MKATFIFKLLEIYIVNSETQCIDIQLTLN